MDLLRAGIQSIHTEWISSLLLVILLSSSSLFLFWGGDEEGYHLKGQNLIQALNDKWRRQVQAEGIPHTVGLNRWVVKSEKARDRECSHIEHSISQFCSVTSTESHNINIYIYIYIWISCICVFRSFQWLCFSLGSKFRSAPHTSLWAQCKG